MKHNHYSCQFQVRMVGERIEGRRRIRREEEEEQEGGGRREKEEEEDEEEEEGGGGGGDEKNLRAAPLKKMQYFRMVVTSNTFSLENAIFRNGCHQ